WCDDKEIPFVGYTSLVEDGEDQLAELIKDLQNPESKKEDEKLQEPSAKVVFDEIKEQKPKVPKKKKSKYVPLDWIIILDDLSTELKSKSIVSLLKKNRHFRCKILVSTQYLNDLAPESRKQIDYWLIFKAQPREKLEVIYKDADLAVPFETFVKLYEAATAEPFQFLYVDANQGTFRKGFSQEVDLEKI